MLDIQSLERRWLRYKMKRYLPYIVVIALSTLSYGLYNTFSPANYVSSPIKKERPIAQPITSKPVQEIQETVLEPSMNFMESLNTSNTAIAFTETQKVLIHNDNPKHSLVPIQQPLPQETVFQASTPPKETIANKPLNNEKKSPTPLVKRDEAPLNIDELQQRFQSNPNPNLGVFIARYHYDHANYTEAYNYALKTNAINNKMEESWLIFAKSLVKLGQIEQARKTLQLYIAQSNSTNAKTLLDSLDKDTKK